MVVNIIIFVLSSQKKCATLILETNQWQFVKNASWKISLLQEVGRNPLFLLEFLHDSSLSSENY